MAGLKGGSQIVIVGCGCGATEYIHKVLNAGRVAVGHEQLWKEGVVSWYLSIGETGVRPPYPKKSRFPSPRLIDVPEPKIILHQVRDPIKNISSFMTTRKASWKYLLRVLPELAPYFLNYTVETKPVLCMKYWYEWTRKAMETASWSYKVEDLSKNFDLFCAKIERPELKKQRGRMLAVSNTTNTKVRKRGYTKITWEYLFERAPELTEKTMSLGRELGYKIKEVQDGRT